jgi:hypothetical protein
MLRYVQAMSAARALLLASVVTISVNFDSCRVSADFRGDVRQTAVCGKL